MPYIGGLSPLARGTRHNFRNPTRYSAVYPRWRGEHVSLFGGFNDLDGLSPLARGTHADGYAKVSWWRFIPAGAGNTDWLGLARPEHTVYPRWRGEHALSRSAIPSRYGLSPLARGTLSRVVVHWLQTRFIPAGAGNTLLPPPPEIVLPVYPRWRGEHASVALTCSRPVGLSPLARGTPAAKVM